MEKRREAVHIGSLVTICDGELTESWRIVAAYEADAVRRLMSDAAPLARALLGHSVGDTVRVKGPTGATWPVKLLAVDD
jgi:transcription elongation factor GreA